MQPSVRVYRSVTLLVVLTLCMALVPAPAIAVLPPDESGASTVSVPPRGADPEQPPAVATEPTSTVLSETTPTPMPCRVEDDDYAVRFAGRWLYGNAPTSGRSYRVSFIRGSSAAVTLTGTAVAWIGSVGPNRGRARVYLDGRSVATIDLYSPAYRARQVLWSADGLTSGKHAVKIVVLGTKHSASKGVGVGVDAFDCNGRALRSATLPGTRVQNTDRRLYRKGAWGTVGRPYVSGKNVAYTRVNGAAYTLRFKGTEVTWFGRKGPDAGRSEVWLDGKKVAVVDQHAPRSREFRVVYAAMGLRNATHTLTIKSLGRPAVSGGGTRTELDAFQVRGKVLVSHRPTPFKYPWKTYIVIDKSSYKLYWVKNGWLIKTYPIAHGKGGCTPERVWRIDMKYAHTGGVYGPKKMRLFKRVRTSRGYRYVYTAYGIHGTNQPWVIGTQASHGCIRMYNRDIRELFPQVPRGTMVVTRR